MCKRHPLLVLLAVTLLITQSGCWSSKEIEDLSLYTGVALDTGELSSTEQTLVDEGGDYFKNNKLTATLQIVPKKSAGGASKSSNSVNKPQYINVSETGDSVLEIFRQFSVRLDRPIIGHHLKVIVISTKLVEQQKIEQLMDFMLRDNDIRPSCVVFLSTGRASDTFTLKDKDDIPSFHLREMVRNRFRSSKVMKPVNLSTLDARMHSKQSFVLQNIIEAKGDIELSGAGIIKGETGKWIGSLDQDDMRSMNWIKGDVNGGTIKTYNNKHETITYEIKSAKSKITSKITEDNKVSFHVNIESDGRLIENWDPEQRSTKIGSLKEREKIFEERLSIMLNHLMQQMQSTYKVEVAGFGERLSIEHPKVWKKLKDHWDDTFSKVPVTFSIKFTITDYGSFNE
ncbi:spore gernimation protein GerC [Paenibacillus helianthi]|uniref:Spore gernimation protein GerC n=1 Tax=Paenibacillus helianthi TaxID=1349432 RepID=A0ABX3EXU6_9BACL|nr:MULTISPECIES: Ger(x)C family spore germination protein [Paenibacillus]OKP77092.1 spore gernimation protein GerC [Paenibacillus sp. P3E]OKP91575.1 spore gernimation protein GerC [Paenibacillus helianthi]OKP93918.1 spore gernimation protein GerC [Paenibacillus sp. P32E]